MKVKRIVYGVSKVRAPSRELVFLVFTGAQVPQKRWYELRKSYKDALNFDRVGGSSKYVSGVQGSKHYESWEV